MKTWTRVRERMRLCGGCGKQLVRGTPVLEVSFGPQVPLKRPMLGAERPANWSQTRLRCDACAGEPVPADLPPVPPSKQTPITPTKKSTARPLQSLADRFRREWTPYREDIA